MVQRGRAVRKGEALPPGTWVRIEQTAIRYGNPIAQKYAVVVEHEAGGGVFLQTHGSDRTLVADFEVVVLPTGPTSKWQPMRHILPYGMWTCADGRKVLFNRNYKPIWQDHPNGAAEVADINEWVPYIKQEYFFDDRNPPWDDVTSEHRCRQILTSWGVDQQPANV